MRLIDAYQFLADESEAYMLAQMKVTDEATRLVNEVVHNKIQMLIADAPTIDAAPQWISVEERLPEEDGNTEAWYESSGGMRARTVIVYDGRSVFPANRFRASTGEPYEWSIIAKNATHWMPLPEPPKEEEEKATVITQYTKKNGQVETLTWVAPKEEE